jgi:hypothetical protein
MTTETSELTLRASYLERELAVWRGRQSRLPSYSLYNDPSFYAALGQMRGELERIKLILNTCPTPTPRLGTGGKRRAKLSSATAAISTT